MPTAAAAGMGVVPGAALLMNDYRTDRVSVGFFADSIHAKRYVDSL